MTSFCRNPSEWQRLDWRLIQSGSIALYFHPPVLERDLGELKAHGYAIYEFRCDSWASEEMMHRDMKQVLKFPDYYGHNLHALQDCLSDLEIPDHSGVALVLHRFDAFAKAAGATVYPHAERAVAEFVLDVLATAARYLMLTGSRFIAMVQSNDPQIGFERLGCVSATWNPKEWLNKNRGL
jgi:RNAse (barnase) inhibitor barstar